MGVSRIDGERSDLLRISTLGVEKLDNALGGCERGTINFFADSDCCCRQRCLPSHYLLQDEAALRSIRAVIG